SPSLRAGACGRVWDADARASCAARRLRASSCPEWGYGMVPKSRCRAVVTLAVVAGCALSFPAAAPAARVVAWSKIERTLQPGFDPQNTNPCNAGTLSCPASAVAEMQNRFLPLASSCSHEAVFSLGYLRTTQAYYAAVSGDPRFFLDNAFVNDEDGLFADAYFHAYDQWYAGNH